MRPLAIFGDLTRSYAILSDLKRFLAMPRDFCPYFFRYMTPPQMPKSGYGYAGRGRQSSEPEDPTGSEGNGDA